MSPALLVAVVSLLAVAAGSVVKTNQVQPEGTFELLILHNNDMHARFEQTSQLSGACTTADRDAGKCYGGFPRVAYLVKKAREEAASGQGPPVLYLNAGDTYTGTAWFTIYKWKIAAEFVNALQPDAVSLGNHEFDNGISGLTPFIENLTTPVLAANLNLTNEPSLQAETNLMNSIIFNINETKVAVIGYLTPETKVLAIGNNVEYIEEVIAIREEIAKLKRENVTIFIALGHSGFAKDLEIAREVEDVDFVIGGHTNTFLWNGTSPDSEKAVGPYPTLVKQSSGRVVPVVQAYAYTKYLGKLHLVFDSSGEIVNFDGNPILLDNTVPQDADVLAIINKYRDSVMQFSEVVVGNTSVILDNLSCKIKECNLGNLITDAMVYKYASEYNGTGWTDAPVAIMQRGGIRAPIAPIHLPAQVTKGDLLTVLPFDGKMVKKTVNGSTIIRMLEYSVSRYTPVKAPGEFLQFSGMKVEYNFRRPSGSRVARVKVLCGQCDVPEYIKLNETQEYNILMSSFLSMGGDGYSMLIDLPSRSLNYNELDSLIQYFQKHSPIYSAVEDRITLINVGSLPSSASFRYLSMAAFAAVIMSTLF